MLMLMLGGQFCDRLTSSSSLLVLFFDPVALLQGPVAGMQALYPTLSAVRVGAEAALDHHHQYRFHVFNFLSYQSSGISMYLCFPSQEAAWCCIGSYSRVEVVRERSGMIHRC